MFEIPTECPLCDAKFKRPSSFLRHAKMDHGMDVELDQQDPSTNEKKRMPGEQHKGGKRAEPHNTLKPNDITANPSKKKTNWPAKPKIKSIKTITSSAHWHFLYRQHFATELLSIIDS